MVGAKGFEPCGQGLQGIDNQDSYGAERVVGSQIDSQRLFADDPELARIVATWDNFPDVHKRTIMAIVNSV